MQLLLPLLTTVIDIGAFQIKYVVGSFDVRWVRLAESTVVTGIVCLFDFPLFRKGQTPKSDIPPNIAPKNVTPEIYLQI